ncbi:substrate binding domain-containing protein [Burkholderia sp. PU8-34]
MPKIGIANALWPAMTGTSSTAPSSSEISIIVTPVGGSNGERTSPKRPAGTRTLTPGICTTGISDGSSISGNGTMPCFSGARPTKICSEWTVLPVDFAVTYLAPLIAEFAHLYPGITFDFDLTSRRIDLVSEPFDVAIRIGESENLQLIARPLASFQAHLYASPGYLERSGEPHEPADLERHECLSMLKGGSGSWTLQNGEQTAQVAVSGRFSLNSVGMVRRLATLDLGIILLPEEIVADELANGRLRRVMPEWQGKPLPVYAITETRLLPAKTQRFIEFLRERLAQRR